MRKFGLTAVGKQRVGPEIWKDCRETRDFGAKSRRPGRRGFRRGQRVPKGRCAIAVYRVNVETHS